MKLRVCAAICGGVILLACSSPAMATSTGEMATSDKVRAGGASAAREAADTAIVGTASMYNPFKPGHETGGPQTASGERYDPAAWTAAIKIDLRHMFGGVRYGSEYRPAYALIEAAGKRAVVRINDVGPLKPGRVIDLNERTMRYFDPSLRRGLIHRVTVTPLDGGGWSTGPVADG